MIDCLCGHLPVMKRVQESAQLSYLCGGVALDKVRAIAGLVHQNTRMVEKRVGRKWPVAGSYPWLDEATTLA